MSRKSRQTKRALEACNHNADMANELVKLLLNQKRKLQHNKKLNLPPQVIIFWGFADVSRRNAALALLRDFFRPSATHVSQVGESRFEGLFICQAGVEWDEVWTHLAMGMGHVTADKWLDSVTLSAIERIDVGDDQWGNWSSKHNDARRKEVKHALFSQQERERWSRITEHVLQRTGMSFTPENMIALSRLYHEAQAEVTRLLRQMREHERDPQVRYENFWREFQRITSRQEQFVDAIVEDAVGQIMGD